MASKALASALPKDYPLTFYCILRGGWGLLIFMNKRAWRWLELCPTKKLVELELVRSCP